MSQRNMAHLSEFHARMIKEDKILGEPPESGMGYWGGESSSCGRDAGDTEVGMDHHNIQPNESNSIQFSALQVPITGRIYNEAPPESFRFQEVPQNLDPFGIMNAEKCSFEARMAKRFAPFLALPRSDEFFYSVQDLEVPVRSFEHVAPTISFETGHTEHTAGPNNNATNTFPENIEPMAQSTNGDLESLKSVSESESDAGSWVNEPTIAELEEKLRDKNNWVKELCEKLRKATKQRYDAGVLHEKQLKEKELMGNKLLGKLRGAEAELCNLQYKYDQDQQIRNALTEENKRQMDSLIRQQKLDFAIFEGNCRGSLRAAENIRLEGLAKVEERILKCNADWTAERKDLVAKLEAKKLQEEAWATENTLLRAKLEAMNARDEKIASLAKVANEGYDELNHETAKAKAQLESLSSKNTPCQKGPLDHDRATFPLIEIKKVMQEFRVRLCEATDSTREKIANLESQVDSLEKELHSLKSSHEEEMKEQEAKYLDRISNQSKTFENQQRQGMSELLMLQEIKVPALEGQVSGLQQLVQNLQDACMRKSELCQVLNRALVSKSESLTYEHGRLHADNIRLQNDNKSLLHDQAACQISYGKLEQMHNRLEMAHEIAQTAHRDLEARLRRANLTSYNLSLLG